MANYKRMYYRLFNATSSAIEAIKQRGYDRALSELIEAQQETEELYIASEPDIKVSSKAKTIKIRRD